MVGHIDLKMIPKKEEEFLLNRFLKTSCHMETHLGKHHGGSGGKESEEKM